MSQEIAYGLIFLCLVAAGIVAWRMLRRRRPHERHLRIDLFRKDEQ